MYTFYLRNVTPRQLEEAAVLIGLLPHVPGRITTLLYNEGRLDPNEVIYCHSATLFAFSFTPPPTTEDFSV